MKILSLDLGTNSIGWVIRDSELGDEIKKQLEKFGVVLFNKGIGETKGVEYSYAAERTKKRSTRRLYQARKYRIWATLDVLIKNGYCPLKKDDLDKWRIFDKNRGLKRQYPSDSLEFSQWICLDFNGDGSPDYSSPYQLRDELALNQLNFNDPINRYKLGRALYHIAQRRGFKSSKGETLKEQDSNDVVFNENVDDILKKSEQTKSQKINEYIDEKKGLGFFLPTVGTVFALLEREGQRIRESWQAVRAQYEDEIKYIFDFQSDLCVDSEFFIKLNEAIFYKRPLRSQKGLVGKCKLEPMKSRCPISHPDFEEFRALSFINNIKFRRSLADNWINISSENELSQLIYNKCFLRTKGNFYFKDIREIVEKVMGFKLSYNEHTINYKDTTNVSGCPISARLKNLFGNAWSELNIESEHEREGHGKNKRHNVNYNIDSIWNVLFSFEDEECLINFAKYKLNLDDNKTKQFINLWFAMPEGYSMLSLKAIRNINYFLRKGLIYTDAVFLAKVPEIIGSQLWAENEKLFLDAIGQIISKNREEKKILNVVNNLIANYKVLGDELFAYKNVSYILDSKDYEDIEKYLVESYGEKTWKGKISAEQKDIRNKVSKYYQDFFSSFSRKYYSMPRVDDEIKQFISSHFSDLNQNKLDKIYHPSQIDVYAPSKEVEVEFNGSLLSLRLLGSPKTGSFKNPMAMRAFYELRNLVNYLIKSGYVTEDARIVIETARELNDSNKRWAIAEFQKKREIENKEYREILLQFSSEYKNLNISENDLSKLRLLSEQYNILDINNENVEVDKRVDKILKTPYYEGSSDFLKLIKSRGVDKIRLWEEQNFCCIYTGKLINVTDLFADGVVDFEHTIPLSLSFDNSLANQTICYSDYNRTVKRNRIPTQLSEYQDILRRIKPWEEHVEHLRSIVDSWKNKSKYAPDGDKKNLAIRQRHLWQFELDYWENKVNRFKMEEVTTGFRNSQLVDTQLISKYAMHYLKTVFSKVEVQKGAVTADFRKILGIQCEYEKKNRDKHSHHAIDAAVLSLIPPAALRDKMLKIFYEIQEAKFIGNVEYKEYLENELSNERKHACLGSINGIVDFIDKNILINNIDKDQILTPARRIIRKCGKIVKQRDDRGNVIYKKDSNGSIIYRMHPDSNLIYKRNNHGEYLKDQNNKYIPIPQLKGFVATGDCIRGQLHDDTFLGAIKKVKRCEDGLTLKISNGQYDCDGKLSFVVRRKLKYKANPADTGFSSLSDLKSQIVDPFLFSMIEKQCVDRTFKDACTEGLWMLNSKDEKIIKDKNGRKLNPIRHVRCFVDAKEPLSIKKQVYLSSKKNIFIDSKEHKKWYYAQNAMNPYYILYQESIGKKVKRAFQIFNLFDVSQIYDGKELGIPQKSEKGLPFYAILKIGTKVLFYKNTPEELYEMEKSDLSKRLYKIKGFEKDGRIKFGLHIDARNDKQLIIDYPESKYKKSGKNGFSTVDYENSWPKLKLSIGNLNMLIEEKDFKFSVDGNIEFMPVI